MADRTVQRDKKSRTGTMAMPTKNPPGPSEEELPAPRAKRRERRRQAARRRMAKHGASLHRVYRDAVEKRARKAQKRQPDAE